MASILFPSSTAVLEEDVNVVNAMTKRLLEDLERALDEPISREKLTTTFPGKSSEEIDEYCVALFKEYEAIVVSLLPFSDCSIYGMPYEFHGGQEPPPIFAPDSSTRELIAALREGLPDQASTKGLAWSKEEHWLFLFGLECFGKGDWKNIAKYFVLSRTSTQIASHAQKFFARRGKSRHHPNRYAINTATQRQYLPSYNMQHGFYGRSVGLSAQHLMPVPISVRPPGSQPAAQPFMVYNPNTGALEVQNGNETRESM